MENIGL